MPTMLFIRQWPLLRMASGVSWATRAAGAFLVLFLFPVFASHQLSLRVKALKRQVDEAEEEIERLDGLRKKAQRELEEQHEVNEQLQARIKALEKDSW